MGRSHFKKILIVKNRGLGDAVIGLSSVQYLKSLYPNAEIHYAVPDWVAPLFEETQTEVQCFYPLDLSSIRGCWDFIKYLKQENFDSVFELHQGGKTGKVLKATSIAMNFKYFFHNHHRQDRTPIIDQGKPKASIQRDLDGIYSFVKLYNENIKDLPSYLHFEPSIKMKFSLEKKNRVILGVVATRETKMWPLKYYLDVAKKIHDTDPSIEIIIPLSKNSLDQKIKRELGDMGLPEYIKIEHFDLRALPGEIYTSKFYVGNDTGLKHIAVSLGVKTYTFFGPENPSEWHPYDSTSHPFFFRSGLECRTRTAHYCGLETCESMECLNQIMPDQVFALIKQNWF